MSDEKNDFNLEGVVTELLLRISTLERLLLDKKVYTVKEYSSIFEASVEKVNELVKAQENLSKTEDTTIFVSATNKNKLEN